MWGEMRGRKISSEAVHRVALFYRPYICKCNNQFANVGFFSIEEKRATNFGFNFWRALFLMLDSCLSRF